MTNIAIIGGGAAGLFAAKKLSENQNIRVFVFEKANKVGTKLRASGGGKANILNADIRAEHYNNPHFMQAFLQEVNYEALRGEFAGMGLRMSIDEEGRVYPATLFSQTVIDVLMGQMGENTTVKCGFCVEKITKNGKKWQINDEKTLFDKVILASGSPAGMIAKNRKGYNSYLSDFQIGTTAFKPSLVGLKIKDYPKSLFGCKAKVEASLRQHGTVVFREKGEVVFKEDGISGIVILNCSAHYNRLRSKKSCQISLDFLPDGGRYDVEKHLQRFHDLSGLLHPKLNQLFMRNPFNIRDFRLEILDTYDLDFAQVCSGGIALSELTKDLELKNYPGIHAVGELLDIDGVCGGYNLFFAFASAYKVAKSLSHGN